MSAHPFASWPISDRSVAFPHKSDSPESDGAA